MTGNNRLGRGFAALISDMREMESAPITTYDEKGALSNGVSEIAVADIKPNVNQPRKIFNEEALAELSASIARHGILQPIVVVKKGDIYVIVAGERRFRAAKQAGLEKVPVIVKDISDNEMRELALIENLQREDLNPMEEAEGLYLLLKENNLTQEELASTLGKSRPAVANSLRLLTLPKQVQLLVKEGGISTGHAKVLLGVKNASLQLSLAQEVVTKKLSVRDLEAKIAMLNCASDNKTAEKADRPISLELKAMVGDMQRVFGTKVRLNGNDKKGKIVIDYSTSDDLQRIYELLEILKEKM